MNFWDKLMKIDRRIIFLFVIVAVTAPLFLNISQEIIVSDEVNNGYQAISPLQPGAKVLVPCDYDPPSAPELQPMAVTTFQYCLEHDLKFVIIGLWPQGPQQANAALATAIGATLLSDTIRFNGKTWIYGRDWANLGYQAGNELVIQRMGSSIPAAFPRDYRGTPISELPLMQGIQNFNNFDFVINISAGYPGIYEWVQFGVDRFNIKLFGGTTAVQAPLVYPYYESRQLRGIMGGLKGAAEFEKLVGIKGKATTFMLSQSFSHIIVILFIIVGNVAYFLGKLARRNEV